MTKTALSTQQFSSLLEESLAEAMVPAELGLALAALSDVTGAQAGFCRFPRPSVGEAGELWMKVPQDDRFKTALRGSTEVGRAVRGRAQWHDWLIVPLSDTPLGDRDSAAIVLRRVRPFRGVEREQVEAVAPIFARAYRRIRRYQSLTGENTGLAALIEQRLGACVALATPSGEIVWMTQSARQLLGDEGTTRLKERLIEATRAHVKDPGGGFGEFVIMPEGKHRVFGTISFVRENAQTSVQYLAVELRGSDVETHAAEHTLTPAEQEVYVLLRQGLANDAIAERRFVSVTTVRSHVKSIFRKLGVSSRLELLVSLSSPNKNQT